MTLCKLLEDKAEAMKALKWLTKASKQNYVDTWLYLNGIRYKEM